MHGVLVCVDLDSAGALMPEWGRNSPVGVGRRTLDEEVPSLDQGVRGKHLHRCKSILEPSSSTGSRTLCLERVSDLSEIRHEFGLDGVLVSEDFREWQACSRGVARGAVGALPPTMGNLSRAS